MPDDFIILRVLELHGFQVRGRERGGFCRQGAVSGRTVCGNMENATRARLTLGFRDRPGLRGSGDEKLTACGAHAAQVIPVDGSSGAPAGSLRTVE